MNKEYKKRKLENPWKLAFFLVMGILIGISCFIFIRVNTLREPEGFIENISIQSDDEPALQIQMTKSQTNKLINYYLNEFQSNSPVKYNFILDKQALLNGKFKFLGADLNFYLYFDPYVTTNGEVQLKAKSLSIGSLPLPISELMNFIKKNFDLPLWVEVDSKKEMIILHLNQFKLENGMFFNVEKIDLIDDDISVSVFLP